MTEREVIDLLDALLNSWAFLWRWFVLTAIAGAGLRAGAAFWGATEVKVKERR